MNWFKPYILFCPHSLENYGYVGTDAINSARAEVLRAIEQSPDKRFRIKMHPSHNDSWFYREWIEIHDIKNVVLMWTHRDTKRLIEGAKLVIAQHSTVALEALELRKPVILVEDEVSDALGEFDEFSKDAFHRVRNAEDILKLIY